MATYIGGDGVDPEARTAIERAIARYAPGGGFGKGVEAALERGRTKAVTGGMQALVSAGLAGTTRPAGLAKKYEEEVGMPTRARVEETRAGAISGLETLKAQVIQGATEATRTRALQQLLADLQAKTQTEIAKGQLGLGYAGLRSARKTALAQITSRSGTTGVIGAGRPAGWVEEGAEQPDEQPAGDIGGYGGDYGGMGGSYGGAYQPGRTPTSTRDAVGQIGQQGGYPWQEDFATYISPEEYRYGMR